MHLYLRFYTATKIHVRVFSVVKQYNNVVGYHRLGGPCYIYIQGEDGGTLRTEAALPSETNLYTWTQSRRLWYEHFHKIHFNINLSHIL